MDKQRYDISAGQYQLSSGLFFPVNLLKKKDGIGQPASYYWHLHSHTFFVQSAVVFW